MEDKASAPQFLQFLHKITIPAIPQAFLASTCVKYVLAPWQAINDRGAFWTQVGHAPGVITV